MKVLVIVFKMLDEKEKIFLRSIFSQKHSGAAPSLQIMDFSGSEIFARHLDL